MFWYNPTNGVYRARVPAQANDRETLALYNSVNSAVLDTLPTDYDPHRKPLAYSPGMKPAIALASLDYGGRIVATGELAPPDPNAPPPAETDTVVPMSDEEIEALKAHSEAIRLELKEQAEPEEAPAPLLKPEPEIEAEKTVGEPAEDDTPRRPTLLGR